MATGLSNAEISRYGRQLLIPEWSIEGQLSVRSSSVLVVGVGGLGCPVALYLAGAGIGHLGLVDYDTVDVNNLHRQVIFTEQQVGVAKVKVAQETVKSLNSLVRCSTYQVLLVSSNAMDIMKDYDVIVDCSDNVATRYLLNDASVLLKKPLVSGSALRFEGQLTVYNHEGGPCYRCLFPTPPPPDTVTNCSDGGVVGAVPGLIGSMQALEALKIAAKIGTSYSQRMLVFDGFEGIFRTVKLRPRMPECVVCGDNPSINELIDYEQFCGASPDDKTWGLHILSAEQRITCTEYQRVLAEGKPHVLLDVREPVQFKICHLQHAVNVPFDELERDAAAVERTRELLREASTTSQQAAVASAQQGDNVPIYCVCRRGNHSQLAAQLLSEHFASSEVKDIVGGLTAWHLTVDPSFPTY